MRIELCDLLIVEDDVTGGGETQERFDFFGYLRFVDRCAEFVVLP